jgi:hypothetical protein
MGKFPAPSYRPTLALRSTRPAPCLGPRRRVAHERTVSRPPALSPPRPVDHVRCGLAYLARGPRGGPLRRSACALAREQDRSPSRVACLALPCAPPQAPRPSARNAKPLPLHSCPAAGPTGPLLIFPASPALPSASRS